MKKIPTLFLRDPDDRAHVTTKPNPECLWVFDEPRSEVKPTRKWDGTCVMFDGRQWWARREVKAGNHWPPNFVSADYDEVTGKTQGWEPIDQSGFAKAHADALANDPLRHVEDYEFEPGTYELIGPKVNGNPEDVHPHALIEHSSTPRLEDLTEWWDYSEIEDFLRLRDIEGIVFHHTDGRMAKIKTKDFR